MLNLDTILVIGIFTFLLAFVMVILNEMSKFNQRYDKIYWFDNLDYSSGSKNTMVCFFTGSSSDTS